MIFNFTLNVQLITTILTLVYWCEKQILTYSQYLIITRELHLCIVTCKNIKINVQKLWSRPWKKLSTVAQAVISKLNLLLIHTLESESAPSKKLYINVMPELDLGNFFQGSFMLIVISQKTYWNDVKKEISELSEDSTDIYKWNMVNRYIIISSDAIIEELCYPIFIKPHQLQAK